MGLPPCLYFKGSRAETGPACCQVRQPAGMGGCLQLHTSLRPMHIT